MNHDKLKGGTVQRIAKMRRYRDEWNAKQASGERRYAGRTRLSDGMAGILQARSHGCGSIAPDSGIYRNDSYMVASLRDMRAFRDVGHVDELFPRYFDHKGWFADAHRDDVWRGHVWQLPARDGDCLYLVGYIRRDGGDAVLAPRLFRAERGESEWDTRTDGLRDACIAADNLAEHDAEESREFSEKWQEASRANDERDDARDELKQARADAALVVAALRQQRAQGVAPMVCDLIRAKLAECRADMHSAIETIAEKTDAIADMGMAGEF